MKILYVGSHFCQICGAPTNYFCADCSCNFGWNSVITYLCSDCNQSVHRHPSRQYHQRQQNSLFNAPAPRPALYESERVKLELFAVVCIKTSHYVSFVKCGRGNEAKWVFFDSMSDRVGKIL